MINQQRIKKQVLLHIINGIKFLMPRQNDDGVFVQEVPEAPSAYDLQIVYPMAYAYARRFEGNTLYGDEEVLTSLIKVGDHIARNTNKEGLMYYYSWGHEGHWLDQRLLTFWIDAFNLIKHKLSKQRLQRWQQAMRRSCTHLEHKLGSYLSQAKFNSYSFGTSPNHTSLYASTLYLGGKYLGKKKWCTVAETFMDRFVALQREAGYWAEGNGPVGVYNGVSVTGVARMNKEMPGQKYKAALLKSLDYTRTIAFPDYTLVEICDRRNQYKQDISAWGLLGLSSIAEGRAYFHQALEAKLKKGTKRPQGEDCARVLEAFVHRKSGNVEKEKQWSGINYLEHHTAFIRKQSWQVNLSVNPVVVDPTPWKLDYGKIFSVWHKKFGLLIDGSQDKNIPKHDTFYDSTGASLGSIYGGQLHTESKTLRVRAHYQSFFHGAVDIDIMSSKKLCVIGQQIAGETRKNLRFGFMINWKAGNAITVGNKTYELSKKRLKINLKKGAQFKTHDGAVSFKLRCDGVLHFPCYPFNSYTIDNSSTIGMARLRLELIPQKKTGQAQVDISINK